MKKLKFIFYYTIIGVLTNAKASKYVNIIAYNFWTLESVDILVYVARLTLVITFRISARQSINCIILNFFFFLYFLQT